MRRLLAILVLVLATMGCGGADNNNANFPIANVVQEVSNNLSSVAVTPSTASIPVGVVQQFRAKATFINGLLLDATTIANWTSSDTAVATVSNDPNTAGQAIALAPGTTTITATDPNTGTSASATLTVTDAVLQSITVTPTVGTTAIGLPLQFQATGHFSDGNAFDKTNSVTWVSTDTAIATVGNTAPQQGVALGVAPGQTDIVAIDSATDIQGNGTLVVTDTSVASFHIQPVNPSTAVGVVVAFTATATLTNGTTQDLTSFSHWESSNPGVAIISNDSGTWGQATGLTTGSTTITATEPFGGHSDSTSLTITDAVLQSIEVTPAVGTTAIGLSVPFTATGHFSDGSTANLTNTVVWSTDGPGDTGLASITSAGLATGITAGTVAINATAGPISGSATLVVENATVQSIQVTPIDPDVPVGRQQQFVATATLSNSTMLDVTSVVSWSADSSNTSAPIVISNTSGTRGLATVPTDAVPDDTADIQATEPSSGQSDSTTLTVTDAITLDVFITPSAASVPAGASQDFQAFADMSDGSTLNITSTATWDAGALATLGTNAGGKQTVVAGSTNGQSTISATDTVSSLSDTATLFISSAVPQSLKVLPQNPISAPGTSRQFHAIETLSDSTTVDVTDQVTWSSDQDNVAFSTLPGQHGLAIVGSPFETTAGLQAHITATLNALSDSTTLTVNDFFIVGSRSDAGVATFDALDSFNNIDIQSTGSSVDVGVAVDGRAVYSLTQTNSTRVETLSLDPSGNLGTPSPFPVPSALASALGVSVHPDASALYVTTVSGNSNNTAFSPVTLDPLTDQPTAVLTRSTLPIIGTKLALDPLGRFAYSGNTWTGAGNFSSIFGFFINPDTTLTAMSSGFNGDATVALLWDPDGKFLYAVLLSGDLLSYIVNPGTGDLQGLDDTTLDLPGLPRAAAISPGGEFIYVIDGSNICGVFVNPSTGFPSSLTGHITLGSTGFSVACDPDGLFVVVTENKQNEIFLVNDTFSGTLNLDPFDIVESFTGPNQGTFTP